ncbi:hypothetical protein EV401DRAFT_1891886 [Pisolithus croceorrhizus]|nr:hypothetical protein EV401DRAFT_1891886 [Pisolithus croceorrhizus]
MGIPGESGSVLIGRLVATMLGLYLLAMQIYVYYIHCSGDASIIKFLVGTVWILDTLHVALSKYFVLITNYGVPTSLEYVVCYLSLSNPKPPPVDEMWQVIPIASFETLMTFSLSPSGEVVGDLPNLVLSLPLLKVISVRVDGSPLTTLCILVLIVTPVEFATTVELRSTWSTGLDFAIGKSSLNIRQHLRSRGSATKLNAGTHIVPFTNILKLPEGNKEFKGWGKICRRTQGGNY